MEGHLEKDARSIPHVALPDRLERHRRALRVATLLVVLFGAVACDPGVEISIANDSSQDVVVREGARQWDLPAHGSGVVYHVLGTPEQPSARQYEILEVGSCSPLATSDIDLARTPRATLVFHAGGPIDVSSPARDQPPLHETASCAGPARGWTLWGINHAAVMYLLRATAADGTSQVARLEPGAEGVALEGFDDPSKLDLLDSTCHVVASATRTGWGDFTAIVGDGGLEVRPGDSSIIERGHFAVVKECS
jgi:hypothetical protein